MLFMVVGGGGGGPEGIFWGKIYRGKIYSGIVLHVETNDQSIPRGEEFHKMHFTVI